MTTRTPEQIEAGARAFFVNEHVDPDEFKCITFDDLTTAEKDSYLESAREVLRAADAAAAPAVGVTVDELREALVALIQAAFEHGLERGFAEYRDSGDRLTAAAAKNKQARDRVFALLTAQPEPGTHGNGCPACDGKGWVEEKCLVCFGDGFDDGDEPGTRDDAGHPAEGGV